jgi:putative hydrolase of the HAD superfamily
MNAGPRLPRISPHQTLLFDADDTLWENNIYFERAIAAFISYLNHREFDPHQVREILNKIEREHTHTHGYGLQIFRRSLVHCFEELSDTPVDAEKHDRISSFVDSIASQEIELLAGVAETLPVLASRHRLILMTKGIPHEQHDKLVRSGLSRHFAAIEVPREKHREAYQEVVARHSLDATQTWMIGNSPRSDINPALAAGLNTVFIPHTHTWVLEHESLASTPPGQTSLRLTVFSELQSLF